MGNHMHSREFLIAAAIGTLLGGVTALLAAPKAGKRLRQDLYDSYSDLSDSMQDRASNLMGRSRNNGWKGLVNQIKCGTKDLLSYEGEVEEQYHHRELIIGTIAGGIFGVLAGLLVAPRAGHELRRNLADKYEDLTDTSNYSKKGSRAYNQFGSQAFKWLNFAKDLVDELTGSIQETTEEYKEKAKKVAGQSNIDDLAEWASLGAKVWKKLRDRNRSYSNK
jgi:gas vesicle protein